MVFEREKKLYTSQDEFIFFMNFLCPGKIFKEQEPKMGNFDQNLDWTIIYTSCKVFAVNVYLLIHVAHPPILQVRLSSCNKRFGGEATRLLGLYLHSLH